VIRSIQRLGLVLLLGFAVVSVGLGYWQVVRANELLHDETLNAARLYEEEKNIQRGRIFDRNGEVLVYTQMTSNGAERIYQEPWLVHVTGHHSLRYGDTGIEQSFDDYLRGKLGADPATVLADHLLHRPVVGNDVVLTIDSRLQKATEEALGDANGAIVVTNPQTGEILALASHPYYDPNKLEDEWDTLKDAPTTPLLNRASQGLYVPGSTFKTVTMAAALDSGAIQITDKFEYELRSGSIPYHTGVFNGFSVYCGNHPDIPPGKMTLSLGEAYASSCNVAFAEIGVKLGHQKLSAYAEAFGFGSVLPIEIASSTGHVSQTPDILRDDAALASTAFGQGELLVTPLHMALATNAIANSGVIMEPHLVREMRDHDQVIWQAEPQAWHTPIQPATAHAIRGMMVDSVEHGWAVGAKIEGVQVAGKTGTAETGEDTAAHAWFTAFAPADNPTIAVTVIKEHAGYGSAEAIPPAKRVIEAALQLEGN
jgi:peptidoglycan glycosyltransferase